MPSGVFDRDLDARADGRAIRSDADQSHPEPVVAVTRILEQSKCVRIAWRGAADLEDDFLVAVVVEVRECDAVPFVHFTRAR